MNKSQADYFQQFLEALVEAVTDCAQNGTGALVATNIGGQDVTIEIYRHKTDMSRIQNSLSAAMGGDVKPKKKSRDLN